MNLPSKRTPRNLKSSLIACKTSVSDETGMFNLDVQTQIKQAVADIIPEVVEQAVTALNKYYSPIVTDLQERIKDLETEICYIHKENRERNE